jgi:hypothetical protein
MQRRRMVMEHVQFIPFSVDLLPMERGICLPVVHENWLTIS